MTGELKTYMISCLSKLSEFKQFQQHWNIEVSVEKEQLPEGTAAEGDDSDKEYEDASSAWTQGDSAMPGHLVAQLHSLFSSIFMK